MGILKPLEKEILILITVLLEMLFLKEDRIFWKITWTVVAEKVCDGFFFFPTCTFCNTAGINDSDPIDSIDSLIEHHQKL